MHESRTGSGFDGTFKHRCPFVEVVGVNGVDWIVDGVEHTYKNSAVFGNAHFLIVESTGLGSAGIGELCEVEWIVAKCAGRVCHAVGLWVEFIQTGSYAFRLGPIGGAHIGLGFGYEYSTKVGAFGVVVDCNTVGAPECVGQWTAYFYSCAHAFPLSCKAPCVGAGFCYGQYDFFLVFAFCDCRFGELNSSHLLVVDVIHFECHFLCVGIQVVFQSDGPIFGLLLGQAVGEGVLCCGD